MSFSRTQLSASGKASNPSIWSQTLHHWATAVQILIKIYGSIVLSILLKDLDQPKASSPFCIPFNVDMHTYAKYTCMWYKYTMWFKRYEHFHQLLTDGQKDGLTQWLKCTPAGHARYNLNISSLLYYMACIIWASTQETCLRRFGNNKDAVWSARLCYSLSGKYHTITCYWRIFNFLASLCSWGDWFEYCFVGFTKTIMAYLWIGYRQTECRNNCTK